MKIRALICRFFVPAWFVSLYYLIRSHALISIKSEVELSSYLTIGKGTQISSYCKVKASYGSLSIGAHTQIAVGCFISSREGGITIGDNVLIGPHVSIVGSNYVYADPHVPMRLQGHTSKGITIGNGVWIGANATILDGARIGNGVIISPNSVVAGIIPDDVIVQGNTGKIIFTRR